MLTDYLNMFKDLQISKEELKNQLGDNLFSIEIEHPVKIFYTDVVNLLHAFRDSKISLNHLLEWVNVVWFTELFEYDEEYCDSIASVLNKLEELDEEGVELTEANIEEYIDALVNNKEI